MLFMGLMPIAAMRSRIHLGEGAILTFFTILAVYLGQRSGFSMSMRT